MRVTDLKLANVRCHKSFSIELGNETMIIGSNGSGKTTVLESLYFLLAMRGFKKQPLSGAVAFGEEFLRIEALIDEDSASSEVILKFDGKKTISIDGAVIENVSDFIFANPIAVYSPDFLGVLSQAHQDRRSFIDRFIFYTSKNYIDTLRLYNRFVAQKAMEFYKPEPDVTYIDVLNDRITELSEKISTERHNLIASVNDNLTKVYDETGLKSDRIYLSYTTNIKRRDILEHELKSRMTQYGVHRDKIEMDLNGKRIEKFSSFGQKKTFVLLCLYSVLKHVEVIRKTGIICLLDDFEAGLDMQRAAVMKDLFSAGRQVLYTGVESMRLNFNNIIRL